MTDRNDSSKSVDNNLPSEKVDTTSFANIMAAVNKMRSKASGISAAHAKEQEQQNKRQKLPERIKPPPGAKIGDDSNGPSILNLPPRINKPTLPVKHTNINHGDGISQTTRNKVIGEPIKTVSAIQIPNRGSPNSIAQETRRQDFQTFNQIQVSRSQTGNPLLKYLPIHQMNSKIKDVDYVINSQCVALFLSLKYHKLHPEYIYNKLKKITYNHENTLRVLLVYIDIDDFQDTLRELDKLCLFNKLTLILSWSNEQCATYLQNLKFVEKEASKRIIQGRRTKDEDVIANEGKYLERVVNTVSSIKSVNQSDAKSLLVKFGSIKGIIESDADKLTNIQGLGQLKVDRLLRAFNEPFTDMWNYSKTT